MFKNSYFYITLLAFSWLLAGCDLLAVKEQTQKAASYCSLYGSVKPEKDLGNKLVVVLLKFKGGDIENRENWSLFDHFVNDMPGKWYFFTIPGDYSVTAFEDRNGDLIFQPDEPAIPLERKNLFHCGQGETKTGIELIVHESDRYKARGPVDIAKAQIRSSVQQLDVSLGQMMNIGEVVNLNDPRFSDKNAEMGMWRPFDFLIDKNAGLYFLEPYSAEKIPVLFVHGINGSPTNFAYLIAQLDRRRFQPWIVYYPTGSFLHNIARSFNQSVQELQARYKFEKIIVVAHSMGGLVARDFIFQNLETSRLNSIPLFVSISSPWGGHAAAKLGADNLSYPVRSWVDMAPGSRFLSELFYTSDVPRAPRKRLPEKVSHHLLFGFIEGQSGDGTVSLESQLRPEAQDEAVRLYGYKQSHTDILNAPETTRALNRLLENIR